MSKAYFIRHASKDGEGFFAGLTKSGASEAGSLKPPKVDIVLTSQMPRSIETAKILYPKNKGVIIPHLNEFDKSRETWNQFIIRVQQALPFIEAMEGTVAVVGHGRWMNVAYQWLKQDLVVGFDFLEWFEHEW